MFTAALFTIARTQKQPKCPLTENWIKKTWNTHTDIHTQRNITQPLKRMKYCHLQQHEWTWSLFYQVKSDKDKYLSLIFHMILLICSGCCSVAQSCLTLCNPMDCSIPGFPVLYHLLKLAQTHVHWVGDAIQPTHLLSFPFLPAFNLSQHQGFSNESAFSIRWPKYWNFSFSISPSNEYLGLISSRID